MVIRTWVFSKQLFSEKLMKWAVASRKTYFFVANYNIEVFKWKLVSENLYPPYKLEASKCLLKGPFWWDNLVLYNEMWYHLEYLYISVNQYFQNGHDITKSHMCRLIESTWQNNQFNLI